MAQPIRWCAIHCVACDVELLVPVGVLQRIAEERTFVTCVPCGDRLLDEGRATAFTVEPTLEHVPTARRLGSSDHEVTRSDSDELVA